MALKLWLRLNGKIDNCGLDTATVTACGGTATFVDGKNGKCLSCNGSTYWRITPFTLGSTATFSFWAKTTDTNAMFFVLGATSYAHLNFWRANGKYYLNKGDSYNNPFQNNGADVPCHADDAWHHFILTFDGSACKLYVDGAYYGTSKTYVSPACNNTNIRIAGGFSNAHQYDSLCLLSDFRVYDHVVSEQDIKELYWGKVLEVTAPWKNRGGSITALGDASGISNGLNPHNLSVNGTNLSFNGSTSYIDFNGLRLSGGTVSVWLNVASKPTAQRMIYCDPTSKMVLGFLSDGNLLIAANGSSARHLSTGMTWGQLNHVVATWDSSKNPTAVYVNGVAAGTGSTSNWTNSGDIAGIGRRIGSGSADYFNGTINSLSVYAHQFTENEAKALYKRGLNPNTWEYQKPMWKNMEIIVESGATWLKVLHHNNPSSNLFTASNCKDNEGPNLFSKLYLFDDSSLFLRNNGTYEFMVKEKLESGSTENIIRWKQSSSPTAATCVGATIISKNVSSHQTIGLVHQSTRTHFDNKSSWWCACGCYTAYQGGIPGFVNVVKTGYIDLYIRIDGTNF